MCINYCFLPCLDKETRAQSLGNGVASHTVSTSESADWSTSSSDGQACATNNYYSGILSPCLMPVLPQFMDCGVLLEEQ